MAYHVLSRETVFDKSITERPNQKMSYQLDDPSDVNTLPGLSEIRVGSTAWHPTTDRSFVLNGQGVWEEIS